LILFIFCGLDRADSGKAKYDLKDGHSFDFTAPLL